MELYLQMISMIGQRRTAYLQSTVGCESSPRDTNSTIESSPDDFSCRSREKQKQNHEPNQKGKVSQGGKVKVQLCRNYLASGYCPYGSKCRFAHGLKELLQNSELSSNFRTKNCKAFYVEGECRYGDRCNFKHDDRKLCEIHKSCGLRRFNMIQWYPELLTSISKKPLFPFSVCIEPSPDTDK